MNMPAASAMVCFCFCDFRIVSYSGSCEEQVVDFVQSMLVFVLPLKCKKFYGSFQRLRTITIKEEHGIQGKFSQAWIIIMYQRIAPMRPVT